MERDSSPNCKQRTKEKHRLATVHIIYGVTQIFRRHSGSSLTSEPGPQSRGACARSVGVRDICRCLQAAQPLQAGADKAAEREAASSKLFQTVKAIRKSPRVGGVGGGSPLIWVACSDTRMTPHQQYGDTSCLGSLLVTCWSPPQVSAG